MVWSGTKCGRQKKKQMNRIVIGIVLVAMTASVFSQSVELPDMTPDRPGFATSPFLVCPKHFQIETGSAYERASGSHTIQELILFNTFLARYGINKILEVRLQSDFAKVKTDSTSKMGFSLITAGAKLLIYRGKGIIPMTSLMVDLTFPFSDDEFFKPESPMPSFYLLMQNDITEKINISYNFGMDFIDGYSVPIEFAAICFEYDFTQNLITFIESYNWFASGALPKNFIDVGGAYLITKNIQLDMSVSMSMQDFTNYFMINGGVSWRIPRKSERE
jgi:hypothetical protein